MLEKDGSPGTMEHNLQGSLRSNSIGPRSANGNFKSPYASIEDKKRNIKERRRVKYQMAKETNCRISITLRNEDYDRLDQIAKRNGISIPELIRIRLFRRHRKAAQ